MSRQWEQPVQMPRAEDSAPLRDRRGLGRRQAAEVRVRPRRRAGPGGRGSDWLFPGGDGKPGPWGEAVMHRPLHRGCNSSKAVLHMTLCPPPSSLPPPLVISGHTCCSLNWSCRVLVVRGFMQSPAPSEFMASLFLRSAFEESATFQDLHEYDFLSHVLLFALEPLPAPHQGVGLLSPRPESPLYSFWLSLCSLPAV